MPARSTAAAYIAIERNDLQSQLARELAQTILDEQLDQDDAATLAGVTDTIVSRWVSSKCRDSVGFVDAILVGRTRPTFAHRLLRFVGDRCGFEIVPLESGPADVPLTTLVERLTALVTAAVAGEADGIITPAEALRELQELNALLAICTPRRRQLMRQLGQLQGDRR